ncbi:MAG: DUF2934 domain-containing protein [Planctomycetota bacterium]
MSTRTSPAAKKSTKKTPAGKTTKRKRTAKAIVVEKPVEVPTQLPTPLPDPPAAAAEAAPQVTDEQIAQRAYEIWLEKGRPFGQENENWAQASAELRG